MVDDVRPVNAEKSAGFLPARSGSNDAGSWPDSPAPTRVAQEPHSPLRRITPAGLKRRKECSSGRGEGRAKHTAVQFLISRRTRRRTDGLERVRFGSDTRSAVSLASGEFCHTSLRRVVHYTPGGDQRARFLHKTWLRLLRTQRTSCARRYVEVCSCDKTACTVASEGRDALLTRSKGHFRPEGGSTRRPAAHPSLDRTSRVFRRISSFLLPPSHFSSHLTSPHTPADRMGKQTRRPRVASRAVGRRVVASTGLKLHSAPAVQHHLHKRRHTAPPIGRRPLETGTVASTSPQPQPPPSANPFRVPTTVLFSR